MRAQITALTAILLAGACSPPSPQPLPNEMEQVVNATRVDPGIVGANEAGNYAEGSVTPAEREPIHEVEQVSPPQAVAKFVNLIVQRRFEEAYQMWDPNAADFTAGQLESAFAAFETIRASVGPDPGGSGEVQLTLSGVTRAGGPYAITGPVTLVRAQGGKDWKVAKMVLTADPKSAQALVDQ